MIRKKKVPLRKCIGCQEQKEKKELLRILKTEDGSIMLDHTGRMNGRGAYVCRSKACLEKARKNHGLERALRCGMQQNVWDILTGEIDSLEK